MLFVSTCTLSGYDCVLESLEPQLHGLISSDIRNLMRSVCTWSAYLIQNFYCFYSVFHLGVMIEFFGIVEYTCVFQKHISFTSGMKAKLFCSP